MHGGVGSILLKAMWLVISGARILVQEVSPQPFFICCTFNPLLQAPTLGNFQTHRYLGQPQRVGFTWSERPDSQDF